VAEDFREVSHRGNGRRGLGKRPDIAGGWEGPRRGHGLEDDGGIGGGREDRGTIVPLITP
jgi:hypothetical protein